MFSARRKSRLRRDDVGHHDTDHLHPLKPLIAQWSCVMDTIRLHIDQSMRSFATAVNEVESCRQHTRLTSPLASISASKRTKPIADLADAVQEKEEPRTLISEIEIIGAEGNLKTAAEGALSIRPNLSYTSKEIEEEMQRMFNTGWFSNIKPVASDTRDGVRMTFHVTPNVELRSFSASGASALPQAIIQDALAPLAGKTINYNDLGAAINKLNKWYEDHGVLGQVIDVDQVGNGQVELKAAEAQVATINLKYVDSKTGEVREEGKTKPQTILRYMTTKPGRIYSLKEAQADIGAVYATGLFEDVSITPQPAEGSSVEAPRVDLLMQVKERKSGGLAAGGGISASGAAEGELPGLIGTISYTQRNLFGLGQKLVAAAELGQTDSTFRLMHIDPWVRGDPYRTSRTIHAQNTKTSAVAIHGRAEDAESTGSDEGSVFISRKIGSVEYGRPLGIGWQGTLGLSWQQARCVDEHNNRLEVDPLSGGKLCFSVKDSDSMALGTLRVAYAAPSGDSELVASVEQAVPLVPDWLNFNRLTTRAEKSVPLGPAKIWVRGKGGLIFGDLPSYEAFPIGGTNSVRGYSEGGVGSGRRFVAGTAELQVPIIAPFEGTLFVDGGTDLDSGPSVLGDPAGARNKPGKGYGFGAGVRIETPLGALRLEYAMNNKRQRRFHLGIGSHG